jgi:hypothetical protein
VKYAILTYPEAKGVRCVHAPTAAVSICSRAAGQRCNSARNLARRSCVDDTGPTATCVHDGERMPAMADGAADGIRERGAGEAMKITSATARRASTIAGHRERLVVKSWSYALAADSDTW